VINFATFVASFPEFSTATETLVNAKLADADARTSSSYGETREQRVFYLTARLLALSPFGRDMKLVSDDGSTAYDAEIDAMDLAATFARGRVC
jgi:hypothetical protein